MARFCENPECSLYAEEFSDRLTPQSSIEVEINGRKKTFGREVLDPSFGRGKLSDNIFLCSACYRAVEIFYDNMRFHHEKK